MDEALQKAVDIIVKVADPDKVILFGSRAREDYSDDSDYDLLVLKRDVKKQRKLAQEIYLNFEYIGASVDVIVADLAKYEELKNDPYLIYMDADKEGKIIYDKY